MPTGTSPASMCCSGPIVIHPKQAQLSVRLDEFKSGANRTHAVLGVGIRRLVGAS